ncbi:ap-5 complex subunit mu-1 [Anaeramoeba ignava]|uniref:Ap-5 complex subunit mu-1 n=1 Tax=Anaeramoeba ignava TaxID=1746090 RepID=A0A9Q0LJE3_ANAIG|nr:ap-5 complex subunit mu-1 [Anaeramoeba ignava]
MFSLRAVWILSTDLTVVFSRHFSTVEARVRKMKGSSYHPIPSNQEISEMLKSEFTKKPEILSFTPVISVENVWPIVLLKKDSFYFASIPEVQVLNENEESKEEIEKSLSRFPEISMTLSFLEKISNFISKQKLTQLKGEQIAELIYLFSYMIPFGSPNDDSFKNIKDILKKGFPVNQDLKSRIPVWKPFLYQGKQSIHLSVQEHINCVQYDREKEKIFDKIVVFGNIFCKALLEGTTSLAVSIINSSPNAKTDSLFSSQIEYIAVDKSVEVSQEGPKISHIRFTPPSNEKFKLCEYKLKQSTQIPIKGIYQARVIAQNKMEITLKLSVLNYDQIPNNFEYFEAKLPFENRGKIISYELTKKSGSISLNKNKNTIKWNLITKKFTGKYFDPEYVLEGTISFEPSTEIVDEIPQDPFFVHENCFTQIRFKNTDYTFSGANIDQKVIIFKSGGKATRIPIIVERNLVFDNYTIWNSRGDVKYVYDPSTPIQSDKK